MNKLRASVEEVSLNYNKPIDQYLDSCMEGFSVQLRTDDGHQSQKIHPNLPIFLDRIHQPHRILLLYYLKLWKKLWIKIHTSN